MVDTYYSDLARSSLHESLDNLQKAQNYLRDAGLPDEVYRVRKAIKLIRYQIDFLAMLPPNDRTEAEAGS